MSTFWNATIWSQFGAAIDMLDQAIVACPDELWNDGTRNPQFWYIAYHTLFFLDLYLSGTLEGFQPPPPFDMNEIDPSGLMPEREFTKDELRSYLAHGRAKSRTIVSELTEERAAEIVRFAWLELTYGEIILDSVRHVQHHTAQLYLLLRQEVDDAPRWISRVKDPL